MEDICEKEEGNICKDKEETEDITKGREGL